MELIPIEKQVIGSEEINAVDTRELHAFLESKQRFGDWIKNRIEQYGFAQDVDFISFHKIMKRGSSGGTTRKEYFATIDMAKELAMVERNEKGRQARRYFIECERKLREEERSPLAHMIDAPKSELFLELHKLAKEAEKASKNEQTLDLYIRYYKVFIQQVGSDVFRIANKSKLPRQQGHVTSNTRWDKILMVTPETP